MIVNVFTFDTHLATARQNYFANRPFHFWRQVLPNLPIFCLDTALWQVVD